MILIAGLIVLAGVGVWYLKFRRDRAPQYQTAQAVRCDLTQLVTATGQLNPVTNVQVGCQISGTLDTLYVDYNSPVTNGQIVARLDPGTYEAILHQTEGDLASAEAGLELAQVNADVPRNCSIASSSHDPTTTNLSSRCIRPKRP